MRDHARVSVIIPALNEAHSIAKVLNAIPDWVDEVIVADNGSKDGTEAVAEKNGARVVREPRRGYGSACLAGIDALDRPDIVVFLDADFSDHPEQMASLVDPILRDEVDMVIGSRILGKAERGALTPQARFGNRLACYLIRLFWGLRYTDLGPFRAIRYTTLQRFAMADPDYGWTVEMQIKAALQGVPVTEVPVDYRKRVGRSKVSGTFRGVLGASYKILSTIFLSALKYYLSGGTPPAGQERLIIFTRYPEPGKTKTRLIPALGPEGAAGLQRKMTEHAVRTHQAIRDLSIELRFVGGSHDQMEKWLGKDVRYREQSGNDLGERMADAFQTAFSEDPDRIVITGIDSPEITGGILQAAFDALKRHDLVLGPATDGGYYLIGMRRTAALKALPEIFLNVDWGTDRVLESTRSKIAKLKLGCALLAPLDDVDRPEDLAAWERAQADATDAPERPSISVIIPALNEAGRIGATLERLKDNDAVEVIVVDGGSHDDTQAIARSAGAHVCETSGGRAAQMNLGSAKARSGVLLFLHADTLLPEDFETLALDCLSKRGTVAGAFKFATDDPAVAMRFMAAAVNLRARWLNLPYGDQGIFLRKELFRELGGYRALPIMEDYEFVRRLARRGGVTIVPVQAVTSARRWRRIGPWRTMLLNQVVIVLYYLGFPPERIAAFYDRPQRRG